MRIGLMMPMSEADEPGRAPTWPELKAIALHAEAIGLDSLWVSDHLLFRPVDGSEQGVHEGWTILSALAACTSTVELGHLVLCATFRDPGVLAKMAATADVVSGGRVVLGLGAGWHDPEYVAFGFPTDHRVSRFEEALQIIGPLLRRERISLDGRYHSVLDAVLLPAPERRIPTLIAGHGPRMLRLVARHADAWNTAWYGLPDDRVQQRLADLRAALEAEDRDPATLRVTVGVEWDLTRPDRIGGGTADALAGALDSYDRLGVDDLIVSPRPADQDALDRIARAVDLREP